MEENHVNWFKRASRVNVPPALLDKVTALVMEQLEIQKLAREIGQIKKTIAKHKDYIKWNGNPERGTYSSGGMKGEPYTTRPEPDDEYNRRLRGTARAKTDIATLTEKLKALQAIPRKPAMRVGEKKTIEVPYDLTGWDTKGKEMLPQYGNSSKLMQRTIKVTLLNSRGVANDATATYYASYNEITVYLGALSHAKEHEVRELIEHELVHWMQAKIKTPNISHGTHYGLPPKSVRTPNLDYLTPEVDENVRQKQIKELKQRGIGSSELHSLTDMEFYPLLNEEIAHLRNEMKDIPESYKRRDFITRYFGRSSFLKQLKKFPESQGKWRLAVKQLSMLANEEKVR